MSARLPDNWDLCSVYQLFTIKSMAYDCLAESDSYCTPFKAFPESNKNLLKRILLGPKSSCGREESVEIVHRPFCEWKGPGSNFWECLPQPHQCPLLSPLGESPNHQVKHLKGFGAGLEQFGQILSGGAPHWGG